MGGEGTKTDLEIAHESSPRTYYAVSDPIRDSRRFVMHGCEG